MSRILPEDTSDWSDDDKAYARDRDWLVPEGSDVDLSVDGDVTPESIRKMTKAKLEALVEEDESGLLGSVNTDQNKAELAESIIDAMFESTE